MECRACDGGDYFDDTLKLVFFKTSSLFRVFSSCLNVRDEDFGVQKRRDDTLVREKKLLSLSFSLFEDEEFLCHKLLAAEKNKNLCSLLSRISDKLV